MGVRGLQFRHGTYYARLLVPEDARPALDGKAELRERLGTDKRQAERDVHAAMSRFHERIANARRTITPDKPVPARPMSLAEIAQAHHARELAFDDAERLATANGHAADFPAGWFDPYRALLRKVSARLASDEEAEAAIGWAIKVDQAKPGTDAWRRLAQTLAAVQLDAMDREAERDAGNFDGPPKLAILDPAKDTPAPTPTATSRVRGPESLLPLNEVVKLMHAEKTGVAASTQNEQRIAMRYFEEFLGEPLPIHAISRRQVIAYKTALPKVPIRYSTRFPGLTLPEAIEANERRAERFPTLAPATVNNKWLAHLKAVFAWATKNDLIPDDPSSSVRLDLGNTDKERSKIAFTAADLAAIQASAPFQGALSERAWGALIALYSGMRAGEIAQLRLEGIRRERGVLIFTVEGDLKNGHASRFVPVHSALITRGLAKRIAELKATGQTMLFPEWYSRGKAILANAAAKGKVVQKPYANVHPRWFNNYLLPSVGIEDRRKTFHCFRHTFKTALSRANVSREISDHICGHKDQTAGARYIHAVPIEAMAEAAERADFG